MAKTFEFNELTSMKNYKRIMNNWRNMAPTLWWGDPLDVRFLLADKLSELNNLNILDISCGHGIILSEVDGSNYKVGLDISIESLVLAKKLNPESNLVDGDAMQLPFKDKSFDVVYAAHVIPGHNYAITGNKETKKIEWINEINRILKKDGTLLLTTSNGNYFGSRKANKIKLSDLKKLLSLNFDIVKIQGFNPLPIYPGATVKVPGIWIVLIFLMKIKLLINISKAFFVVAKPKQ